MVKPLGGALITLVCKVAVRVQARLSICFFLIYRWAFIKKHLCLNVSFSSFFVLAVRPREIKVKNVEFLIATRDGSYRRNGERAHTGGLQMCPVRKHSTDQSFFEDDAHKQQLRELV